MASSKQAEKAEKEHENFSRYSRLLLEVAPKVLRKLLETHALTQADTLDGFFTDIDVREQLEGNKFIHKPQLALIYPKEKACGNLEDWDITLICAILKSTCSLSPEDLENVDKIRKLRNEKFAHTNEPSLSDKDFHDNWANLSSIIVDIGKTTKDDAFLNDINNSITLIEQGVHAEILKTWQKDDDYFVETRASEHVQQILLRSNIVTLTGVSGSGKSGIAHHAALMFGKQGYTIYPVTQADEVIMFGDLNKRQVFVLDDPVGKHEVDWNELIQLEKRHQKFMAIIKGDIKIILTCRKNILNDERFMSYETLVGMGLVDLCVEDNHLTENEKKQMFEKYAKKTKLSETQKDTIIRKTYIKFPLLCKVFGANLQKYESQSTKFFSEPFSVLLEELATIKHREKYQYCALLLCLIYHNSFDIDCLNAFSELFKNEKEKIFEIMYVCGLSKEEPVNKIENAFNSLVDVYFIQEDTRFRFIHDVLFDVVAYQFGTDFPCEMLKYCSSKFMREHVRTQNAQTDDNLAIRIKKKHYTELTKRLYSDLSQGNFHDVFLNPSMRDESFADAFCNHTRSMQKDDLVKAYFQACPNLERYESACSVSEPRWDKYWFIQSMLQDGGTRAIHWLIIYNHFDIFSACHSVLENLTTIHTDNKVSDELTQSDRHAECQQGAEMNLIPMACLSGNVKMLETVLKDDPSANITVQWGGWSFCILHLAAVSGQIEMVETVFSMGIRVDYYAYGTPLFIAAGLGYSHICDYLLNKGANVNRCRSDGSSPLWQAAVLGHTETVSVLLRHKAKINQSYRDGATPLFVAARKGHTDTVAALLDNKADVHICRIDGVSPLYIAASKGHIDVVSLLLKHKAIVNLSDIDNMSPLFVAAKYGYTLIVDLLLQNRAYPNVCDRTRASPLFIAARQGHTEIVSSLLNHDAKVNLCRVDGASPLFIAARSGWTKIVSLMLEHKADINLCQYDSISPLHAAAMEGHNKVLSLLLPFYKNVNILTRENHTPLYMACQAGSLECVTLLLQARADANITAGGIGCSPIREAKQAGYEDIVRALISAGADETIQAIDSERSPVAQAVGANETIQVMDAERSPVTQAVGADETIQAIDSERSPVAQAVGANETIQAMDAERSPVTQAVGADETIQAIDSERSPVAQAVGANETIQVMDAERSPVTQAVGADETIQAMDAERSSVTQAVGADETIQAMDAERSSVTQAVGADETIQAMDAERSPVTQAVGADDTIQEIDSERSPVTQAVEADKTIQVIDSERSPVTPAVGADYVGADDIGTDDVGADDVGAYDVGALTLYHKCSPLKQTVNVGTVVIVQAMDDDDTMEGKAEHVNSVSTIDAAKVSRVDNADITETKAIHIDAVDAEIKADSDVHKQASDTGHEPLIKVTDAEFIDVKKQTGGLTDASIGAKDTEQSPLIEEENVKHINKQEAQIRAGPVVNIDSRDTGCSPLAEAARDGHVGIVETLIKAGAGVNEISLYSGRCALMEATKAGHTDVVKALINAGANVNISSKYNGRFPLIEAAKAGHSDIIDTLVSAGAIVNNESPHTGLCPLIEAAMFGRAEVVKKLIHAGAKINTLNRNTKRSALMEAAMLGHTDVVKALISCGADVNMKSVYTRCTALAEATKKGRDDIVKVLKDAGAYKY